MKLQTLSGFVLALTLALVLGACQVGELPETQAAASNTGNYIIIDAATKAVLSTIETDRQNRMVRSVLYNNPEGGAGETRRYYYDQNDRVNRMDETTPVKGYRSVIYTSEEVSGEDGELQKLVISSSAGDTYENTFIYDEAGKLSSSRLVVNGMTTLRKEYGEPENGEKETIDE